MINNITSILKRFIISRKLDGYKEFLADTATPKRALVSYLAHPLLLPPKYREKRQFSNRGIAQNIPYALNKLGYIVDIVDYRNKHVKLQHQYDLFISHAGENFDHLAKQLSPQTIRIYFATGLYWKQQNKNASERLRSVAYNHGHLIKAERISSSAEELSMVNSHAIICLGNKFATNSFSDFPIVKHLNNGVYPHNTPLSKKNHLDGQKHFLFFSGAGCVHKGLDLLLDAFVGSDAHLHICQNLAPDFKAAFSDKLFNQPNIHYEGFVAMRSEKFLTLANLCNWTILPTCSEGQPGSVLECMSYGLIPIVSKYANIDLGNWGIEIEPLSEEGVRAAVDTALSWRVDQCTAASNLVQEEIQQVYSEAEFQRNFAMQINEILSDLEVADHHA